MKTIEKKGMTVSELSLGTVQLGMSYGISNSTGKPDREEAFSILDTAAEEGITVLDTAAAYGDSASDAPMLRLAERAVWVNPKKRIPELVPGAEIRRWAEAEKKI